ncbi:hypothetical protein M407DRAFT_83734, partial [Tulasnella calospora MUT 4182]
FHRDVLSVPTYANSLINLVIDEGHCCTEWGGSFRPDYATLGLLRGRIRTGLAVTIVSATLPLEINKDLVDKFRLSNTTVFIEMSNNRPNVALSVRPILHPAETFSDLRFTIPRGATALEAIPCQLVYFNSRLEAEDAADALRSFLPPELKQKDAIAFYHARVGEKRKRELEAKLSGGGVWILCCTDAVGMGCDIRSARTVILWKSPPTFCALAQRAGRAARDLTQLGEAILFVSKAVIAGTEELEIPEIVAEDVSEAIENEGMDTMEVEREAQQEDLPAEEVDINSGAATSKRRCKMSATAVSIQDSEYLGRFVSASGCRRAVWNEYFENARKDLLDIPTPEGARCCDKCQPEPVILSKAKLKLGKRKHFMDDIKAAIHQRLIEWRDQLLETHYPNCGFSITAPVLLSDSNINILADCANPIRTIHDLNSRIRWSFTSLYGQCLLEELEKIYLTIDFNTAIKPPPPKKSKPSLAAQLLGAADNPSSANDTLSTDRTTSAPRARGSRSRGRGSRGGSALKESAPHSGKGAQGRGRG